MTNTTKMEMTLGNNITEEEGNIPNLEINSQKNGQPHTHYLTPFRGYGFQVSETIDGRRSRGTTEFVGLEKLVKGLDEGTAISVMYSMIIEALFNHTRITDTTWNKTFQEDLTLNAFATQCYEWVKNKEA